MIMFGYLKAVKYIGHKCTAHNYYIYICLSQ
jgi:hypothetical protein